MFRSLSCFAKGVSFILFGLPWTFTHHFCVWFTISCRSFYPCLFLPTQKRTKYSYYSCVEITPQVQSEQPRNLESIGVGLLSPHSCWELRRQCDRGWREHGPCGQEAYAPTPTLLLTCRWPRAPSLTCVNSRLLTVRMEVMRIVPTELAGD